MMPAASMTTFDIDTPALKEILWHKMRGDLSRYIPDIAVTDRLMCPTCCRFLPFDHFTIEHIIPQQALADDPPDVRAAISRIERGAVTLLCQKQLLIKGKKVYDKGCNSWKGRFYDKFLREIFNGRVVSGPGFTSRHQVALFVACYLAIFSKYGYQVTLSEAGLIMRQQFFSPNRFIKGVPVNCQMTLMGEPLSKYSEESERYWKPPFKITIEQRSFLVGVRNVSLHMPMSRNPETPIAHRLPFAPSKYALRPDFRTVFH